MARKQPTLNEIVGMLITFVRKDFGYFFKGCGTVFVAFVIIQCCDHVFIGVAPEMTDFFRKT